MRAESTYTKLHEMCLWGLWNYSLQAAENTIIPILISQLKKLHRVGIYTASNLSYSDPLHAVGDCKKCSETAVGNVTQWIPAISAVKRFAVYSNLTPDHQGARGGPGGQNSSLTKSKLCWQKLSGTIKGQ